MRVCMGAPTILRVVVGPYYSMALEEILVEILPGSRRPVDGLKGPNLTTFSILLNC